MPETWVSIFPKHMKVSRPLKSEWLDNRWNLLLRINWVNTCWNYPWHSEEHRGEEWILENYNLNYYFNFREATVNKDLEWYGFLLKIRKRSPVCIHTNNFLILIITCNTVFICLESAFYWCPLFSQLLCWKHLCTCTCLIYV